MATRQRNSPWLYLPLGVVALASTLFHFRSLEQMFPQWFGITRAEWPFLAGPEDKPHFVARIVLAKAQKAGLQDGDQLLAINGHSIRSRSDFADLLASSKPGSSWRVQYRRGTQSNDRSATFLLERSAPAADPLTILPTWRYRSSVSFLASGSSPSG